MSPRYIPLSLVERETGRHIGAQPVGRRRHRRRNSPIIPKAIALEALAALASLALLVGATAAIILLISIDW